MVGKPIPKAEKERIHHIDFVVDTLHLRHQNVVESAEEAGNLQELLDQLSVQSGLPVKISASEKPQSGRIRISSIEGNYRKYNPEKDKFTSSGTRQSIHLDVKPDT